MREKNISEFNKDVMSNEGYVYTTGERLSCRLGNQRLSQAVRQMVNLNGKSVIDIGCGDGTYTMELLQQGAASVVGVDAAEEAIKLARIKNKNCDKVHFETGNIYELLTPEKRYDVAVVRGILHHLYDPEKAVSQICRVAHEIVVIEPNGYNPILKIIEKTSKYHIEHEEKSYRPGSLDRWFELHGGKVVASTYAGLVPMFCPDYMARVLKFIEPFVEKLPIFRKLCCAVYVQKIEVRNS